MNKKIQNKSLEVTAVIISLLLIGAIFGGYLVHSYNKTLSQYKLGSAESIEEVCAEVESNEDPIDQYRLTGNIQQISDNLIKIKVLSDVEPSYDLDIKIDSNTVITRSPVIEDPLSENVPSNTVISAQELIKGDTINITSPEIINRNNTEIYASEIFRN
jgi:hypothetical protein